MQKISTYLYPNRIQLLADLAAFTVEYTNVYQRPIKLYKGIDNTLEFEFKNADQKRISITPYTLTLTVMDNSGQLVFQEDVVQATATLAGINYSLTSNVATITLDQDCGLVTGDTVTFIAGPVVATGAAITVLTTTTFTVPFTYADIASTSLSFSIVATPAYLKGIGTSVVGADSIANLDVQTLRYSVADLTNNILFYGDTRFGASGTLDILDSAFPITRKSQIFTQFYGDLSYSSLISEYFHSTAIPVRFYEAIPTTSCRLDFVYAALQGTVVVEATTDATISNESWVANPADSTNRVLRRGVILDSFTVSTSDVSATKKYTNLGDYTYIRVTYLRSSVPVAGTWVPGTGTITKLTYSTP